MLAYSTIGQMGFMLLAMFSGVVGGNTMAVANAWSAAMFYVITYAITTLGTFGIVMLLARQGFEAEEIADMKGLNRRSPWYAFVMLLLMFSLAGIPPTVGFYAKLVVLQALLGGGMGALGGATAIWLAVVAVLLSLVAAFYYLRVVKVMYFDEPADSQPIVAAPDMDNGRVRHKGDSLDAHSASARRFLDLMRRHGVKAYLTSHTHNTSVTNLGGVWQIDSGHARGLGDKGARSTFLKVHVKRAGCELDIYRDDGQGGPYTLTRSVRLD
jgi:NADH:ubiquinone oxidoreductase subunit 5 (subunit L)/multisubunit Na+/H+ antiporter MnhA subunit